MEKFKKHLDDLIPELNTDIEELHGVAVDDMFLSGDANMYEVLKKIDEIETKFVKLEQDSVKYNSWQEVLQTAPTGFENLEELREDFTLRQLMWRSLKDWEELTEKWINK
jgi:dynein heavy chain